MGRRSRTGWRSWPARGGRASWRKYASFGWSATTAAAPGLSAKNASRNVRAREFDLRDRPLLGRRRGREGIGIDVLRRPLAGHRRNGHDPIPLERRLLGRPAQLLELLGDLLGGLLGQRAGLLDLPGQRDLRADLVQGRHAGRCVLDLAGQVPGAQQVGQLDRLVQGRLGVEELVGELRAAARSATARPRRRRSGRSARPPRGRASASARSSSFSARPPP